MRNRSNKRPNRRRRCRRIAGVPGVIAVAVTLACALAGCSTPPETKTLSLAPTHAPTYAPERDKPRAAEADVTTGASRAGALAARVVSVEVLPVTDQNAGNVFGSRMIVSGLDERLVDALNALNATGAKNANANDVRIDAKLCAAAAPAAPGVARVSFAKAYIHGIYQTKSAVVVLKLEHAGGASYFRAQRTGLNWTGGEEEFRNALIRAFDEAVAKLRPELLKLAPAPTQNT